MENYEQRVLSVLLKSKEIFSKQYELYAIPLIMAKKFMAYSSMKDDLLLVNNYLDKLHNEKDLIIKSSLTYSMIAIYGKLFTDASKAKNSKLDSEKIFDSHSEYLKYHNYMMSLRHDFISHRGNHIDSVGVPLLAIDKKDSEKGNMIFNQIKLNAFSNEKLNELKQMFDYLLEIINIKIEKSAKRTFIGLQNKYSLEELEKFSIKNL